MIPVDTRDVTNNCEPKQKARNALLKWVPSGRSGGQFPHLRRGRHGQHLGGRRPRAGFCHMWLKHASFRETWLTPAYLYQCLFSHQTQLPPIYTLTSSPDGPFLILLPLPFFISSSSSLPGSYSDPVVLSNRRNSFTSHLNTISSRSRHVNRKHFPLRSLSLVHSSLSLQFSLSLMEKEQWPFSI